MKTIKSSISTSLLITWVIFLGISCNQEINCDVEKNAPKNPQCIQEIIEDALTKPSSGGKISKYCYQGEVIFDVSLFNVPDASSGSFRKLNCELICSGGTNLTGDYEGDCSNEFLEQIEFVEVVWEDPR